MHSQLNLWLAQARAEELHRRARAPRELGEPQHDEPAAASGAVTLRFAFPDDVEAVARLAVIDSSEPPAMPVLLAEVDGSLWAALSLADGRVVADPFRPTVATIELLRARSRQLGRPETRARPPRGRLALVFRSRLLRGA